jgi:hypothetical protein
LTSGWYFFDTPHIATLSCGFCWICLNRPESESSDYRPSLTQLCLASSFAASGADLWLIFQGEPQLTAVSNLCLLRHMILVAQASGGAEERMMEMPEGDFRTEDLVSCSSAFSGTEVPYTAICSVGQDPILLFGRHSEKSHKALSANVSRQIVSQLCQRLPELPFVLGWALSLWHWSDANTSFS